MSALIPVRTALISVSDKTGLFSFASSLRELEVRIISTGGTAAALRDAGFDVTPVEQLTGMPEMLSGRVKTLHPAVHAGLLAIRTDADHSRQMRSAGFAEIDLLCVNLYPFERTAAIPGCSLEAAVEQIDIGGPAMIRSAAKNHAGVAVLTSPMQYERVVSELLHHDGATTLALRSALAREAFAHTARYDAAIAAYLDSKSIPDESRPSRATQVAAEARSDALPERLDLSLHRTASLRYGENPHQLGALYSASATPPPGTIPGATQLHGKDLSFNNIADAAAALALVQSLAGRSPAFASPSPDSPAVAACVVKHLNPCGCASSSPRPHAAKPAADVISAALRGDPLASFGGVLALAGILDLPAAQAIVASGTFLEVIVATRFDPDALETLRAKSANVRLLAAGSPQSHDARHHSALDIRSIDGGFLVQTTDRVTGSASEWKHAAGPPPSSEHLRCAAMLEAVGRSLWSNAVCIGGFDHSAAALFGAGMGQVDRVTSCRLAVSRAGDRARGAVAYSDAFFPFPDGPAVLIDAGVKTIVHPGGSKRDQETFDLCASRGVTCLTTAIRRFRH